MINWNRLSYIVTVTVVSIMVQVAAIAGPLEDGKTAFSRQDYHTALKLWQPLAEQGDATAQDLIGVMYDDGNGVKKDPVVAGKWFRKAADQGDTTAQIFLGEMYDIGHGVKQDYVQAYMWLSIGARLSPEANDSLEAVTKKMTAEQISEAKGLAASWEPVPALASAAKQ